MSRELLRLSDAVTIHMCWPRFTSENSTWPGAIQLRPDALRSQGRASPLSVGTIHVPHGSSLLLTVYAIRAPSGENTGLIFDDASLVSGTLSPAGSIFK